MKLLKINNNHYKLSESWDEVSIKKFQLLSNINKEQDELDQIMFTISILGNIPIPELEELDMGSIDKIYQLCSFVKDEPKTDVVRYRVEVERVEYGLDYEWKKMKAKTYIDLDELMKDKNKVIENLHYIAAILFRKISGYKNGIYEIEDYDHNELDKNAEYFAEKMPITSFLPVLFFFSELNTNLLKAMAHYSLKALRPVEMTKEKKKVWTQLLKKTGVGF